MREIIPILWTLFVIVAVISSVVSNVRKMRAGSQQPSSQAGRPLQPPQQQNQRPPAPPRAVTFGASGLQAQFGKGAQPVVPPVPQPAPAAPIRPRRAAIAQSRLQGSAAATIGSPDLLLPHERPRRRRTGFARLLGSRTSLARAVVAAEVLGKPHALRDEYSWRCQ